MKLPKAYFLIIEFIDLYMNDKPSDVLGVLKLIYPELSFILIAKEFEDFMTDWRPELITKGLYNMYELPGPSAQVAHQGVFYDLYEYLYKVEAHFLGDPTLVKMKKKVINKWNAIKHKDRIKNIMNWFDGSKTNRKCFLLIIDFLSYPTTNQGYAVDRKLDEKQIWAFTVLQRTLGEGSQK